MTTIPFDKLAAELGISGLSDLYEASKHSDSPEATMLAAAVDARVAAVHALLPHVDAALFIEDATLAVMIECGFLTMDLNSAI